MLDLRIYAEEPRHTGLAAPPHRNIQVALYNGLSGSGTVEYSPSVYHTSEPKYNKVCSYKELKSLMADLKRVYAAPTEEIALAELDRFDEKWDGKYPKIAKSRKDNWANLSTYFKYPEAVRRLIYSTNAIEGFNRQPRKVIKSKTVFPSDDSLLKMLYLAMMDITKKWTGH